ncbi:YbaB/EbfC family nucleoid-associated protein [Glycomyces salinus]|uniref:YbaB/EbfC family nucleoid-associated protein n=1 Tax=Glycomyces salinus TaxID=980294 RepID=UPI0018EC62F1|nr:YbaB/EbfC family nucleoid-associated protein [Glycomyces salinus]
MSRSEQGWAALTRAIEQFEGIRENLARSMRAEAVSSDGSVRVLASAEHPYAISIDTDRASYLEPEVIEANVLRTHNQAHQQLQDQILAALPGERTGTQSREAVK